MYLLLIIIASKVSNKFTIFSFIMIVRKEERKWEMYYQSFTALACFLHSSYYIRCFKTCHFVFPNLFVRGFPDLSLLRNILMDLKLHWALHLLHLVGRYLAPTWPLWLYPVVLELRCPFTLLTLLPKWVKLYKYIIERWMKLGKWANEMFAIAQTDWKMKIGYYEQFQDA